MTDLFPDYFSGWKVAQMVRYGDLDGKNMKAGAYSLLSIDFLGPEGFWLLTGNQEGGVLIRSMGMSSHSYPEPPEGFWEGVRLLGNEVPSRCVEAIDAVHRNPHKEFSKSYRMTIEHEAPHERCNCGYGAFYRWREASEFMADCLGGRLKSAPPYPEVVLAVRGWGNALAHRYTFRSQYMEVLGVVMPPKDILRRILGRVSFGIPNRESYLGMLEELSFLNFGRPPLSIEEAEELLEASGISLYGYERRIPAEEEMEGGGVS